MSSTNRSNARDLHIADYYKTPEDKIQEFLNEFLKQENIHKDIKILDPCAGGDINNNMSYPNILHNNGFKHIDTIDIREDSLADIKGDYLNMDCKNKYDMIITNPPFNIALNIIQKALEDVKDGGYVIMLLRLNFLEGKARKEFWKDNMSKYIFVHSQRMSFTNDGKTDSIAYAHYVWKKDGNKKEFSSIKII